jgi:hypothetical protein
MITTWDELELPILRGLADLEDNGSLDINDRQLAVATGLTPERVSLALRRLHEAGFISATAIREGQAGPESARFALITLLERGLRAAGAWPTV